MKSVSSFGLFLAFVAPLSAFAHADYDFCKPVFEACAAQGYAKDETAPVGKKIWLNCASTIIDHKKAIAKVDMDPQSFEAKNCRDYREAKAKFDAEWDKNHQKPQSK